MRIICSTSNNYLHILPIFCYLFNNFWSQKQDVTIIGYNHPNYNLPDNFDFVSLNDGDQQTKNDYARHLREYLESIDDNYFIYTMEDTFIKNNINFESLNDLISICNDTNNIGRIDLTEGILNRSFSIFDKVNNTTIIESDQYAEYRISCQMSIWNKKYILKYLKDGYSPWDFEIKGSSLAKNDGYKILGTLKENLVVPKNEGCRVDETTLSTNSPIPKKIYNLDDIDENLIKDMIKKNILT